MNLRVKEVCKEKGILFKNLAKKLGITDIALRQSLTGNPTLSRLEEVASALGVRVVDLFVQEQSNGNTITCPHCGKSITIKAE